MAEVPGAEPARLVPGTHVRVITVSDGVAAGSRTDLSGDAIEARILALGGLVDRAVVADDVELIRVAISTAAADHEIILTTGGTGLTPRDVTPQATRSVLEYEIPGMAEAMRAAGRRITPLADLSRAVAGVLDHALVINLPGSPHGAVQSLGAIEAVLAHAVETLAGPHDHDAARRSSSVPYDRPVEDAS